MSKGYGPLADRPDQPVVGLAISHESADLHVTGNALYTEDLVGRTTDTLHAWPVQAPHAHALVTGLRVDAGLRRARRGPGADRRRTCPGSTTPARSTTSRCSPTEVMFYGHAVCWVLGETLEAARQGAEAIEVDYEPLPSLVSVADAIAAEQLPGPPAHGQPRRRRRRRWSAAAHRFSGEFEFGGQEHFYLETQRRAGAGRRERPDLRPVQHPAPVRDPGHRRARARACARHQVTVQCLRMGGGFGGKEFQPHGLAAVAALGATLTGRPVQPAAEPHPGHHDDRQAAPVPAPPGRSASTPTSGSARCAPR